MLADSMPLTYIRAMDWWANRVGQPPDGGLAGEQHQPAGRCNSRPELVKKIRVLAEASGAAPIARVPSVGDAIRTTGRRRWPLVRISRRSNLVHGRHFAL